jgi:hypothetical protein
LSPLSEDLLMSARRMRRRPAEIISGSTSPKSSFSVHSDGLARMMS